MGPPAQIDHSPESIGIQVGGGRAPAIKGSDCPLQPALEPAQLTANIPWLTAFVTSDEDPLMLDSGFAAIPANAGQNRNLQPRHHS